MQHDELITCECDKELPNSYYTTEVTKDLRTKFCFGCGCLTNSVCKINSDFLIEQLQTLPEIYKEALFKNKYDEVMIPTYYNEEKIGIIFLSGTNRENIHWVAAKAKKLNKPERRKLGTKYKPDMENAKTFKPMEFMKALEYLGITEL